jgi:hypothetical protein
MMNAVGSNPATPPHIDGVSDPSLDPPVKGATIIKPRSSELTVKVTSGADQRQVG